MASTCWSDATPERESLKSNQRDGTPTKYFGGRLAHAETFDRLSCALTLHVAVLQRNEFFVRASHFKTATEW
jgi:hypothetical protein